MGIDTDSIRERRDALRREYDQLQEHLKALARERAGAEQQVLRIGGAIKVLNELLAEKSAPEAAKVAHLG